MATGTSCRTRALLGRASAACVVALLGATSRLPAAPTVWVEPSWTRVSTSAPAGAPTSIDLAAARGEYESFQIIVHAPSEDLSHVDVQAADLVGPSGQTLSRENVTFYRERYVYVSHPSPNWGGANRSLGAGWYPDALIPFVNPATGDDLSGATYDAAPFSVAAGKNQPVWVDVYVPRGTPAGQYQGTCTVTSDQGSATVTLLLQIWNFQLPPKPALRSCFGNRSTADGNAVEELLRNRLMPRAIDVSEESTLMDTAGLNSANAGFWSGADGNTCRMSEAPSAAEFQEAAAAHQANIFLYAYTADEVEHCTNIYTTIKQWARNMHQSRILNLITIPPVPELFSDGSGTGRSAVDIWVVLPKQYDEHRDAIGYVQDKGDLVWSYNCLEQDDYSPKWLLDFAPINYRIQPGFLNQSVGLTGLLYWSVNTWTADPWNDVHTYEGSYPGEGMLVYPGTPAGLPGQVVPSMRLKYLRDGVDDYDYIEMLKVGGFGDWALPIVRGLAPDWRAWTRDPAALEAARRRFAPVLAETFRDVPLGSWAFSQILACRNAGIVTGYNDDSYRPIKAVTRDQMAVYLARALAGGEGQVPTGPAVPTFRDVPTTNWAYHHVEYVADCGVAKGYPDGSYRPTKNVTRDEMAVFVARSICDPLGDDGMASYVPPDEPSFRDVPTTTWAYNYIEYLHQEGVVQGFDNGTYRPTMVVTRDQMAVYVARAFALPLPTSVGGVPIPPS